MQLTQLPPYSDYIAQARDHGGKEEDQGGEREDRQPGSKDVSQQTQEAQKEGRKPQGTLTAFTAEAISMDHWTSFLSAHFVTSGRLSIISFVTYHFNH